MKSYFISESGHKLSGISENQIRELDRLAEKKGLGVLQMMENAGRNLASFIYQYISNEKNILILAGTGGNGGGGISCARHLLIRGLTTSIITTKDPSKYIGPAKNQIDIISNPNFHFYDMSQVDQLINSTDLIIDALIGYSLKGPPNDEISILIEKINRSGKTIFALDIPTGINSNDGSAPGNFIKANHTVTLAYPKHGLSNQACGKLFLANIGIPNHIYEKMNIPINYIFSNTDIIQLTRA